MTKGGEGEVWVGCSEEKDEVVMAASRKGRLGGGGGRVD